ncbi:hypothetical protein HPG69_003780 [Diceros bicornis minor]|uniref:SCAN box domain-containing protein n=1 Tax=Diceros bicornis minor TaxID=77932 RepID=A0A7J7ETL0_DICBM|nr:hypothetical protein HPG69_003780 [Diceros bicornis minor]
MSAKLRASSTLLPQISEERDGILVVKMEEEEQACDLDSSLHWSSCYSPDTFRQRFRQFGYQESPGPREALSRLRQLCPSVILNCFQVVFGRNEDMPAEKLAAWEITQESPSSQLKPVKKQLHSLRQKDKDTRTTNIKSTSRQKTSSGVELHSDVSNTLHMHTSQSFTYKGTCEQDSKYKNRIENAQKSMFLKTNAEMSRVIVRRQGFLMKLCMYYKNTRIGVFSMVPQLPIMEANIRSESPWKEKGRGGL